MKKVVPIVVTIFISFFFIACARPSSSSSSATLKIGLMPAVDAAPFLLVKAKGMDKAKGLDLQLIVFQNAIERQAALQSGSLDGTITDLVAFAYNVTGGFDLVIGSRTEGMFPFLCRADATPAGKPKVGMMEVSVSNFLADEVLGGLGPIEKIFINDIPARLEALKLGAIDYACLPEPIASMGQLAGLEKRIYPNAHGELPDILVFTREAYSGKRKAVSLLYACLDEASAVIRENPSLARDTLVEEFHLDPRVRDMMALPEYRPATLPSLAYVEAVSEWIDTLRGEALGLPWKDLLVGPPSSP